MTKVELNFKKGLPEKEGHYIVRTCFGRIENGYFDGSEFDVGDITGYTEYSQKGLESWEQSINSTVTDRIRSIYASKKG